MRFQSEAHEVLDEIELALGHACAEIWFHGDQNGRRLKVAVASCGDPPCGPRVEAANRILAGRGLLERVDFLFMSLSKDELDAAVQRVPEALSPLGWQAHASRRAA